MTDAAGRHPALVGLELRFPWRAVAPAPAPVYVSAATFTFASLANKRQADARVQDAQRSIPYDIGASRTSQISG
jgi:hypothetical protein